MLLVLAVLVPALAYGWCVGGAPPARDPDDDGLNDIQEEFFATDSNDPDSDDDGIADSDEDNDGDGIPNKDEPHIFSLEFYRDIFSPSRRFALVLEGSNLFDPSRGLVKIGVGFPGSSRRLLTRLRSRRNLPTRIYLRLSPTRARKLLGETFGGDVRGETRLGVTNALHPVDMGCVAGGPPDVMGAAVIRFKLAQGNGRRYIVIGGCNLVERDGRFAVSKIRVDDHDIPVRAPGDSVATLPARIIIPGNSSAVLDPLYPWYDLIQVGDTLRVVTSAGVSNGVAVEDVIADLRIPNGNLDADHDRDGLTSAAEVAGVTDPLSWDTDHDLLSDGVESAPGSPTDPLDPDTDADGILDGDE